MILALGLMALSAMGEVSTLTLINPTMEAQLTEQDAPDGWTATYPEQHTFQSYTCRSPGAAWMLWYESTIRQSLPVDQLVGKTLRFGGYLYMPPENALRRGTKCGKIVLKFYDQEQKGKLLSTATARPIIAEDSQKEVWIRATGMTTVPEKAKRVEIIVECDEGQSGDGVFFVDDVFLEEIQ